MEYVFFALVGSIFLFLLRNEYKFLKSNKVISPVQDLTDGKRNDAFRVLCLQLGSICVVVGLSINFTYLDLSAMICAFVAAAIRSKKASIPLILFPLLVILLDLFVGAPAYSFQLWFRFIALALLGIGLMRSFSSPHEVKSASNTQLPRDPSPHEQSEPSENKP